MVRALPADTLQMGGQASRGMYVPFAKTLPFILWTMKDDAVGVARHEAIHHLRQYGFFNKDEWASVRRRLQSKRRLDGQVQHPVIDIVGLARRIKSKKQSLKALRNGIGSRGMKILKVPRS